MQSDLLNHPTRGLLRALCFVLLLVLPSVGTAQQIGVPQSEIVTISSERLFAESAFGRRVIAEIEAEGAALAAENERIVEELSAEEKELTERRGDMPADEFRPLAAAFDNKVQEHRDSQRAKLEALSARGDETRGMFMGLARPVLIGLMRDTGASLILERADVFLSSDATDITDVAIERIDAAIGDGRGLEQTDPE